MRYELKRGKELPQLLLTKDDLRSIQELTKTVLVPKSVDGLLIEPFKFACALRAYFIAYKLNPPFDVEVSPYPGGL